MTDRINTLKLAMTDAQIDRVFGSEDTLGLDVQYDEATGRTWFHTTQPEARVCTDLQVGDRVIIVAMSSMGALGEGSTYVAEIEDIEPELGLAWVAGR